MAFYILILAVGIIGGVAIDYLIQDAIFHDWVRAGVFQRNGKAYKIKPLEGEAK